MLKVRTNKIKKPLTLTESKRIALLEVEVQRLIDVIKANHGFEVRREELKRGIGWRAQSGVCRLFESKLLLLDKRLELKAQIEILQEISAAITS